MYNDNLEFLVSSSYMLRARLLELISGKEINKIIDMIIDFEGFLKLFDLKDIELSEYKLEQIILVKAIRPSVYCWLAQGNCISNSTIYMKDMKERIYENVLKDLLINDLRLIKLMLSLSPPNYENDRILEYYRRYTSDFEYSQKRNSRSDIETAHLPKKEFLSNEYLQSYNSKMKILVSKNDFDVKLLLINYFWGNIAEDGTYEIVLSRFLDGLRSFHLNIDFDLAVEVAKHMFANFPFNETKIVMVKSINKNKLISDMYLSARTRMIIADSVSDLIQMILNK